MNCNNCDNENLFLKRIIWKIDSNIEYEILNNDFSIEYMRNMHKEVIKKILMKYIEGKYSKENINDFIQNGNCIFYYHCQKCNNIKEINNPYYTEYNPFINDYFSIMVEIFKGEFNTLFFETFKVKYLDNLVQTGIDGYVNLIEILFDINDKNAERIPESV